MRATTQYQCFTFEVIRLTGWSNIRKTTHLKYKVTIAQYETIPNIWNGTMYYVW